MVATQDAPRDKPETKLAPTVIKIGGHQIADTDFLAALADAVAGMQEPVIIVHGGGREISDLQQALGIQPHYIDGVRVTDADSLKLVKMVLAGMVNKRLVSHLLRAGVDAAGITGVDRGLIRARKMPHDKHDMGFTGDVIHVRGELLRAMLVEGVTPVIAPLCLGDDTDEPAIFNVNADHVAGAVGTAAGAGRAVFVTNVGGVLADGQPIPQMDAAAAEALIADGTIHGGMIPKVRTALGVLARGVPQAVITDLDGLARNTGTAFTP